MLQGSRKLRGIRYAFVDEIDAACGRVYVDVYEKDSDIPLSRWVSIDEIIVV